MQFRIFISYSSHDLSQVDLLRQGLENSPIDIFVAEHSVAPSENLSDKITEAINNCDLFVLLWSANAEASGWVSQEIGHAKALKKNILPLVLNEGVEPPGFISNLKYLPVYQNPASAFQQARDIIVTSYDKKTSELADMEAKQQKEKDNLVLLGAGAFLLWAFSK